MASKKDIAGLPSQGDQDYYRYKDVHMDTAKGLTTGLPDIRMNTAKSMTLGSDIRMDTARGLGGGTSTLKNNPLKSWEKELLDSTEVKRKSTVAQLCKSTNFCPILLLTSYLKISLTITFNCLVTSRLGKIVDRNSMPTPRGEI